MSDPNKAEIIEGRLLSSKATNNFIRSFYSFVGNNLESAHLKTRASEESSSLTGKEKLCDDVEVNDIEVTELDTLREKVSTRSDDDLPAFDLNLKNVQLYSLPIRESINKPAFFVEIISRIEANNGAVLFPRKYIPKLIKEQRCLEYDFIVLKKLFQHVKRNQYLYQSNEIYAFAPCQQSIRSPEFFENLISLSNQFEFDLSRLCFDLNVSILEREKEIFEYFSEEALSHGCRMAASVKSIPSFDLVSLSNLNLSYLKLSAQCLDRINTRTKLEGAVHGLVKKCEELSMPIVAEHVDRKSLKSLAEEMGVRFMQGYLISPPVHIDWANFS